MNDNLRIKDVLREHHITMLEIAKQLNITQGSLSAAMNGNPTINYLAKVAEIIGCKTRDLLK